MRTTALVLVCAGWMGCGGGGSGSPAPSLPPSPSTSTAPVAVQARTGEQLFALHCATCHGAEGRGDGTAAVYLFPKPRDFSRGSYKIRTTANGNVPTDADLEAILAKGIPGSAMPAFNFLTTDECNRLIAHLKGLAVMERDGRKIPAWESRGKPRLIQPGTPPASTPDLIARGATVYQKMSCASCHGKEGRGDGPSAPSLHDDWGYPIPPNDFTRGIYKGGGTDRDIYMRFTTGLNGTPMPSYEELLTDEERWALVYYVKSLAGSKVARASSEDKLVAARVDKLPGNPVDPAWDRIPSTDLPLMASWQRQAGADLLRVRAAHDDTSIVFLLEWEDDKPDGVFLRPQDFSDAAAVQFGLTPERGHFAMGERNRPVNLWHWKLDRQADAARRQDMEDLFPGMMSDDYPWSTADYGKPQKGWPPEHVIPKYGDYDPEFLSGRAAGNPASAAKPVIIQDLNAAGFGTLEPQPVDEQNVTGMGVWVSGKWRVLFTRPLASKGAKDAPLRPGSVVDAAFAVWNGTANDRNGRKLITTWQKLEVRDR